MNGICLDGTHEAGCHGPKMFSTYHNIDAGKCLWCKRTVAELEKAGAVWVDVLGREYHCPREDLKP